MAPISLPPPVDTRAQDAERAARAARVAGFFLGSTGVASYILATHPKGRQADMAVTGIMVLFGGVGGAFALSRLLRG
jgi:hypothetical protein